MDNSGQHSEESKKLQESWMQRIWSWWTKEQEKLCPHCGYYCTGKSIFCLPPANVKKEIS